MIKKALISTGMGLVIFILCLFIANTFFTVEAEEFINNKSTWIKANILKEEADKKPILMINTQNDVQVFEHEQGNSVVVNRSELIKLFSLMKATKDTSLSVLLDINLRDSANYLPGTKDSLQSLFSSLPFVCMPSASSPDGPIVTFKNVHYGSVAFTTTGEHLDKIKLLENDSSLRSLPLVMYNRLNGATDRLKAGWLIHNCKIWYNYVWPYSYLKYDEKADTNVEAWPLESLIKNLKNNPDYCKVIFHGRKIFIGDFAAINGSGSPELPNVFILANTYLTLVSNQQSINYLSLILTLLLFILMSYFSFYKSLPSFKFTKKIPFVNVLNKYGKEWISYGAILSIWTLLSSIALGTTTTVIPATIIFTTINYLEFKKYKND